MARMMTPALDTLPRAFCERRSAWDPHNGFVDEVESEALSDCKWCPCERVASEKPGALSMFETVRAILATHGLCAKIEAIQQSQVNV